MKKLFLIISLLVSFSIAMSQTNSKWGVPYIEDKKAIIYEEVVPVEGATKTDLYGKAINWINTWFTAGANKITDKNAEEGYIKLKDRINLYKMDKKTKVNDVAVDFHIEIFLKENKYKFVISNFKCFQGSTSYPIEKWMDGQFENEETALRRYADLNTEMTKMIEGLKKAMTSQDKPSEDW